MSGGDTEMLTGPSGEGSSAGASSSAVAKRPKRFEIKKWNAVALWAWGKFLGRVGELLGKLRKLGRLGDE
jgi:hypothetical protein